MIRTSTWHTIAKLKQSPWTTQLSSHIFGCDKHNTEYEELPSPSWRELSQLVGGRKGPEEENRHAAQKEERHNLMVLLGLALSRGMICELWVLKKKLEQTIQNNQIFEKTPPFQGIRHISA